MGKVDFFTVKSQELTVSKTQNFHLIHPQCYRLFLTIPSFPSMVGRRLASCHITSRCVGLCHVTLCWSGTLQCSSLPAMRTHWLEGSNRKLGSILEKQTRALSCVISAALSSHVDVQISQICNQLCRPSMEINSSGVMRWRVSMPVLVLLALLLFQQQAPLWSLWMMIIDTSNISCIWHTVSLEAACSY